MSNIPLANVQNYQQNNVKLMIDQGTWQTSKTTKTTETSYEVSYSGNSRAPPHLRTGQVPLIANPNGEKSGVDLYHLDPDNVANVRHHLEEHHNPVNTSSHEGHKPTSKIATFANLIKGNIGTGILSLPYAMKNAGLLVGSVGLVLVGFLCTYCMHQLLGAYRRALRTRPGREMDYADVAEACFQDAPSPTIRRFAGFAKHTINFFLVFTQVGICCVYLNFCPSMVKAVLESYAHIDVNIRIYQAVTTALLIPYCFVRHLHILAIFSTIANFLTMASLIVIMQHVFRHLKSWEALPLATSGSEFFMFLGTAMFAYESITFVLPFEMKMKDRGAFHYWNGLMSLAMVVVIVIYATVAFYGYLAFGADAMLILKNMPNHWIYSTVRLVYAVCIFLSYSLQLFIPVQILWPPIRHRVSHNPFMRHYGEYVLRTSLVLLSFLLAAFVPCLEQMISLVGSLAISSLALVFPPIMEIVSNMPGNAISRHASRADTKLQSFDPNTKKPVPSAKPADVVDDDEVSRSGFYFMVFRGVVIVLIGVAASIIGTYVTVVDIVKALSEGTC